MIRVAHTEQGPVDMQNTQDKGASSSWVRGEDIGENSTFVKSCFVILSLASNSSCLLM